MVACPRCRRAKVVEQARRQTTCPSCSRTLRLADLRAFHVAEDLDSARLAAGQVNARLAGRASEFGAALVPSAPRATRHDGPLDRAAAMTRRASSEKDRADLVARALGDFTSDQLAEAFHVAGLPAAKAEAHLARMLATDVVYEPSPGRYRAF